MGSFKQLPASIVDSKYEGGVKVYLESEEDVRIFSDHWFSSYQDKIRFESAEQQARGGGGCCAVIRQVEEASHSNMPAYGIVDRDILLADGRHDLFWEIDDTKFHAAQPYTDRVHVLCRWELENYLLKPEAISAVVALRKSRPPIPHVTSESLLVFEEDLVNVTALTTFMVAQNQGSPNPGFGQQSFGDALKEEITSHLGKAVPGKSYDDLAGDRKKIKAFSEDRDDAAQRWDRLARIFDGKKALSRICSGLGKDHGIGSLKPWEEIRGSLADKIASMKLIDKELSELIERFSQPAT